MQFHLYCGDCEGVMREWKCDTDFGNLEGGGLEPYFIQVACIGMFGFDVQGFQAAAHLAEDVALGLVFGEVFLYLLQDLRQ